MPGSEFDGYPMPGIATFSLLKPSVPGSGFDGQPSGRPLVRVAVKMIANSKESTLTYF